MRFCLPSLSGVLLVVLSSCGPQSTEIPSPTAAPMNKQATGAYTGHLVAKPFVNKAGKVIGPDELYLRLSMGDFFIKFSESQVTSEQLQPLVDEVISVKGELRDGTWDIGPDDPPEMQSRIGPYFIITELL